MPTGNAFLDANTLFTTFGSQHLLMIGLTVGLTAAVPWLGTVLPGEDRRLDAARALAVLLSGTVVAWTVLRLLLGEFDARTDLPLDLCNLTALLLPALVWHPSRRIHEVLYFWVLAGTFQAVLTPNLVNGFPHFTFFKYWIVHGGLLVIIVFVTAGFRLYPTGRGILRAFGWLHVYLVAVVGANLLLGANYFYVLRKPPTASLLDVLGPWPWYLLVCEGLVLLLFGLAYAPVALLRRRAPATR